MKSGKSPFQNHFWHSWTIKSPTREKIDQFQTERLAKVKKLLIAILVEEIKLVAMEKQDIEYTVNENN